MGGGGSSAKSSATQATNIISEVVTTNLTKHHTIVQQEQYIRVSGNYNIVSDVVMNQAYEINISEATTNNQIASMQSDITSQLQQAASSASVAMLDALGGSQSEIDVEIENEIKSMITTENITDIAVNVNQSQGIDISGSHNIVKNITFKQFGKIIDENVRNQTQRSTLITTMDTVMSQEATATTENPLDAFTNMIRATGDAVGKSLGLGALGMWAPALLIIILVGIAYFISKKRGSMSPMLGPLMNIRLPSPPIK